MKLDLAALIVGLIAVAVGALGLLIGLFSTSWAALGYIAPFILIGIGAVVLIMAFRKH
jgi:putative Mn2+ efflux pump MntP